MFICVCFVLYIFIYRKKTITTESVKRIVLFLLASSDLQNKTSNVQAKVYYWEKAVENVVKQTNSVDIYKGFDLHFLILKTKI